MQNYVHKGNTLSVTAPYNVASGGGVLIGGTIFGVAVNTVLSGAPLEIDVVGVFDLAKDSSAFVQGAPVYWDNTALECTSNLGNASGANSLIGVAELVQASGTNALGGSSGDATVRVRLNAKFDNPGIKRFHATYNFAVDGGAAGVITPAANVTIPAQTVLLVSFVNSTTAVTSGGSATVEIGTTAGSSATAILGSTAKASLSANALLEGAITPAAPVKMSAAGQVELTVGTAALTAGVIEIELWGFISPS